jgi:hypothetical protein
MNELLNDDDELSGETVSSLPTVVDVIAVFATAGDVEL